MMGYNMFFEEYDLASMNVYSMSYSHATVFWGQQTPGEGDEAGLVLIISP